MVEKNYSYLVDEILPKLGFNEIFNDKLRAAMKVGVEPIELKAAETRKVGEFTYKIVLEKNRGENLSSDQEPYYFANRIEVSFKKNGEEKIREHTFGLYKQRGHSREQIRNLMNGNYVHNTFRKGDETVGRWQGINFNKPKEDGTFELRSIYDRTIQWNVTKELSNLPHINSLTQEMKEDMLRSLYNGDNVAVSLKINGNREQVYIRANPRTTSLDIYNADGQKITLPSKNSLQLVSDEVTEKQDLHEAASIAMDACAKLETGQGQKKKR